MSDFFKKLKGDRKYFAIVFFILILIFLSGVLTPVFIQNEQKNWRQELTAEIQEEQNSITSLFNEKENELIRTSIDLKSGLHKVMLPRNSTYGSLIRLVNEISFDDYSVEILAPNGKLIAWNSHISIPQNDILPLAFPAGQTHFYSSDLTTYLTLTDTVLIDNETFYFVVSREIEKHFTLLNPYFNQVSFSKDLSDKFLSQVSIDYTPFSDYTHDGRKYSFELLNNSGNKIGLITFTRPALAAAIESTYQESSALQSVLVFITCIFFALGFKKEFSELKLRTVKIIISAVYLFAFRMLLYYVNFPSSIFKGPLVDPAYFSSAFGNGIVRSPVELFVTALFLLIICVNGFRYLLGYFRHRQAKKNKRWILLIIFFLPSVLMFLTAIRGLCASVKSIIFDSALRYFKEANLIPNLPSMVMNLNLLMLGVSTVLFLTAIILFLFSLIPEEDSKKIKLNFLLLFILFQTLAVIFINIENEPLITPLMSFIFICFIFILSYRIYVGKSGEEYNFIYATLIASFVTISLLNYFNVELERQSLKTTAFEINRPNDNLLRFLINETLLNASNDGDVILGFGTRSSNFNAIAFRIWANSSLQKESLNSSVSIWNAGGKQLGNFNVGVDPDLKMPQQFSNYSGSSPKIIVVSQEQDSSKKLLKGIIPVYDRSIKLGYITTTVGFDLQNLSSVPIPEFLESEKNIINSVIDVKQLKIFELEDLQLKQVYGDIYPSRDQLRPIVDADYSQDNEAWVDLNINGDNYFSYALKTSAGGIQKVTAVLSREKRISWDLFNFFKIFLVHSIFIITLFLIVVLFRIKNYRYSFRAQLLLGFLLVSLIPIIILAVYNRQVVRQRSQTAILNDLSDRTNYVEKYIKKEIQRENNPDLINVFEKAGQDLGISFAIYENTGMIYNSREQFYKMGLFTDKINPKAYYELNYQSFREYLAQENVEGFVFDAFYRKILIDDRPLIIGVNDAFNNVRLSFSVMDIDVFLFGIFSFTTLMMILLSAFLANRMSLPIRRLTKATDSVAHGDLNVELENTEKGELRELYERFNTMTKELLKNQSELAQLERENAWKETAKQVAHEIKNPLTPMKLAVQQLAASYKNQNKNFDVMFEKLSATILNQIENLNIIASEFSRFARMPNFNLEEVDLLVILRDTINLFLEENVKIKIKTSLNSAFVEADKSQLRRLFINFIRNSIQAKASNVEFDVSENETNLIIKISDNGSGIPEKLKDKLFEPNFTTKGKGMGLGLKLAKRFIEGINGSISIEGNYVAGAMFIITIPRNQNILKKNQSS